MPLSFTQGKTRFVEGPRPTAIQYFRTIYTNPKGTAATARRDSRQSRQRLPSRNYYLIFRRSAGADHFFRPHQAIKLRAANMAQPDRFLAQRGSVRMRGLRDLRGLVVADLRRQCRYQHE